MKYFVFSIKLIIILAVFGILNTRYQIPNTAYAEGVSLKIQPSNLQIRAKSPADIRAPFTLTNQSDEAVTLSIVLKRFRDAGDETGSVVFSTPGIKTEADRDQFLKSVQIVDDGFVVPNITLGPKQQKKLLLRIELPKNASTSSTSNVAGAGQDHYFSVIFLSNSSEAEVNERESQNDSFTNIQAGLGLPVLLSVNQKDETAGFLDEFSSPLILQSGPVPLTVKVKNTGEHFVEATGVILIKNMFGQTVGKVELPKTNILSGSTRSLSNNLIGNKESIPQNIGKAIWSEPFLLGFYTATLTLAVSPDKSLYTQSVHFVAFPLVGSIILFSTLLIGILLIRRIKKKMN